MCVCVEQIHNTSLHTPILLMSSGAVYQTLGGTEKTSLVPRLHVCIYAFFADL